MAAGDVIWDGSSGYMWAVVEVPTSTTPAGIARAPGVVLLNAAGVATTPVTGYTEDAASAADPIGPMMMARRRDTLVTNEVSATGDNIALNATNKGELHTRNLALEAILVVPTTVARLVSAAGSDNATNVKASAGTLFHIIGYNAAVAIRYLKIYNKATAPTVGTDVPILTYPLPPSAGFAFDIPEGLAFATGIGYGLVTGAADNSTAAVTAADIVGLNILYV